ncbi:MAG: DeoR/GlpR family DNA-binding transcription regulator [Treponema sp.]|nr:DeoR/GlpR family DNA-binding transcription regulator [Treponema sp.]
MSCGADRTVRILDLLASSRTIKISLLVELLAVSYVTLRRDLDILEKRGIIKRSHGFITLDGADDIWKRFAVCHSIKKRIAKAAAETVEEGETILLESGSCCALFAEELSVTRKKVTIITNSIFIANYVCKMQNVKIILLGGILQPESQVLIGPMTINCAGNFFFDKFFIGADGYIPGWGFSGSDHLRVSTVMDLTSYAKKCFILTEAAKFSRRGAFELIPLDKIAGVFTDDCIPKEAENALLKNNISIYKVPSVEEKIKWRQFPGQPPILYTEKDE